MDEGLDRARGAARLGACLVTAAGGAMDAWVYLAHGHVFANAQTGNVVLFAVDLMAGDAGQAVHYLPSIAAFIAGLLLSRLAAAWLKRRGFNSRTLRLSAECVTLLILASFVGTMPDDVVTACVGFIAAVQITSLSHIGSVTFNTGMTTGNLRGAMSAAVAAWLDPSAEKDRAKAVTLGLMCLSFLVGALIGSLVTSNLRDGAVWVIAGLIACAVVVMSRLPDPIPDV